MRRREEAAAETKQNKPGDAPVDGAALERGVSGHAFPRSLRLQAVIAVARILVTAAASALLLALCHWIR